MFGVPGTFRMRFHKVTSHEVGGPVFGQAALFLFSRSDDSNKRKDIGCFRCVGDGHFNAGSLWIVVGTEKVYPFPPEAGHYHDLVSKREISNATHRFLAKALIGAVMQVLELSILSVELLAPTRRILMVWPTPRSRSTTIDAPS